MKTVFLLTLFIVPLIAQEAPAGAIQKKACGVRPRANLLYQPVVIAMWKQDEGDHPYAVASGFIRIAVHPTWHSEYFFDVVLNRVGPPTVIGYSLPNGTKTITSLIEAAIKKDPCADANAVAALLSVKRRRAIANSQMKDLIEQFFAIRLAPRHISLDQIRLDATEYEVEFVGEDTLLFNSDDPEAPMVKWAQSFVSAVNASTEQSPKEVSNQP
jgi:hypothetical protein